MMQLRRRTPEGATVPVRSPLQILIVDGSREDREEAKAALLRGTRRRLSFVEAELGADAIAACQRSPPPSCVLLDDELPDMNSMEVIEHLRTAAGSVPKVPVVIFIEADQDTVVGRGVRAGAMGFIGKDWLTPESLSRVVESAMERHELAEHQARLVTTLQEREDRLRLALEAGQAGTFHHDLRTDEVTWSSQMESILGYDKGRFPATFAAFLHHIHPEDLEAARATIDAAIAACTEYRFEFRVIRTDGSVAWLAGKGRVYCQHGGRADTITGVAFDVTERKVAEEALRDRERQLSLALSAGGLGLWDWDIGSDRAMWSEQAWNHLEPGGTFGPVDFERWLARVHPDDRASATDAIQRSIVAGSFRHEFRVLRGDEGVRWLESTAEVLRDGAGKALRMVGVVRDVTERKLAEFALRESEARFRQMSETIPQIVYTCDAAGRCLWANHFWYSYTGKEAFSQEEALDLVHADDREALAAKWSRAIQRSEAFACEYRIRRSDGAFRWQLSRAVPVRNEAHVVVQWVGTSTDIHSMRSEAQLREDLMAGERAARAHAEVENQLKDEFLATVSHELRTPLSNVLGWARVIQKKFPEADPQMKKALAIIVDNALTQSRIIEDMLDLNRIMRGKVTLDRRPLDLTEFVEQCWSSHRPSADARNLALVLRSDLPIGAMLWADRARLQQVLGNLLTNAIKFTPAGGEIWLSATQVPGWFEIRVGDNGEGIPLDQLPFIFNRFRQGGDNVAARHGGLGLGLAIVRELTTLHGGEVIAASDGPGHGALFTVRLPTGDAAALSAAALQDDPIEPATYECGAGTLAQMVIYVVDDDPSALGYTCTVLREHGADVYGFASGVDALNAVSEWQNTDVRNVILVTDMGMRGMDGFALVHAIRSELGIGAERLPVVAATGFAREEDQDRAYALGVQAYLLKPYEALQLISTLVRLRRRRNSEPAPSSPAR